MVVLAVARRAARMCPLHRSWNEFCLSTLP